LIQKKTGSRLPRHKAGSSCAIPLNQKHTIPLLPMSNGRNLVSVLDLDNIASFSIRPLRKHPEVRTHMHEPKQVDCISLHDVKVAGKANERPIGRLSATRNAQ
jgi:hypothetical protein